MPVAARSNGAALDERLTAPDERAAGRELRRAGVVALVALAVLNVADVITTRLLLGRGGIELNPIADRLLRSNLALVVKLGIVIVLGAHFIRRRPSLNVVCTMWMVVGVYALVVTLGITQLVVACDR